MGHQFGPASSQYKDSVSAISKVIKQNIIDILNASGIDNTTLIITADHGQINVEGQHSYLFDEEVYSSLIHDDEEIVLPSGGARSIFLNIKPDKIPTFINSMKSKLAGKAIVTTTDSNETKNLFGHYSQHEQFANRVGNVLILPKDNVTIWHNFIGGESYREKGDHGGLSQDEMYVPLVIERISPPIHPID